MQHELHAGIHRYHSEYMWEFRGEVCFWISSASEKITLYGIAMSHAQAFLNHFTLLLKTGVFFYLKSHDFVQKDYYCDYAHLLWEKYGKYYIYIL